MKKSGIYQIRNIVNDKVYVGHSVDIRLRWHQHKTKLRYNKHNNSYLQRAWNKYGEHNFIFEILEETELLKTRLEEREQYYLDFSLSFNRDKGYMDITLIQKLKRV